MPTTPADNLSNELEISGGTIEIGPGEYAQNVSFAPRPGTTIVFLPGAVIRGLFWVNAAVDLTILDPRVTWRDGEGSRNHMVKINGGKGVTIKGGELWDARSYAGLLLSGGLEDFDVDGVWIHDTYPSNSTNQDHLIYANGVKGGIIQRCLLERAENGRGIKLGTQGSYLGPDSVEVAYNTIVDTYGPSNVQLSYRARNCVIHHNILVGSSQENITAYSPTLPGNNRAYDNIGWAAGRGAVVGANGAYLVDGGGNITADPSGYRTTHGHLAGVPPTPPAEPEPTTTEPPVIEPPVTVDPCLALRDEIAAGLVANRLLDEMRVLAITERDAARAELEAMTMQRDLMQAIAESNRTELDRYTLDTTPTYRKG